MRTRERNVIENSIHRLIPHNRINLGDMRLISNYLKRGRTGINWKDEIQETNCITGPEQIMAPAKAMNQAPALTRENLLEHLQKMVIDSETAC